MVDNTAFDCCRLSNFSPNYILKSDEGLVVRHTIEKIYSSDLLATINEMADAAEDFLKAFFGANIVLSIFTSAFLQRLWGLVNAL